MSRLRALMRKEFNQIRRDKRMAISLIVPPTLQLLLFGFALDSTVSHLRLGAIDWSQTPESREMISTLTESKSFRLGGDYASVQDLEMCIRDRAGRGLEIQKRIAHVGFDPAAHIFQFRAALPQSGVRFLRCV